MRNGVILFSILFLPFLRTFSQDTIPNSSFENWSIIDSVEAPDNWIVTGGFITKESPAFQGDYAIRLTVDSTHFENIRGHSRIYFPVNKIPYKLSGVIKSKVSQYDTVYIHIGCSFNNNVISTQSWTSSSTIGNFTPFEIIIDTFGFTEIDKVAIHLISGCCNDLGGSASGTSLVVDDLKLEFYSDNPESIVTRADNKILVFPNPSNNMIFIQNNHNLNVNTICLTDNKGKKLNVYSPNTTQIDISTLAKGQYILRIETNKTVIMKTIIKN